MLCKAVKEDPFFSIGEVELPKFQHIPNDPSRR